MTPLTKKLLWVLAGVMVVLLALNFAAVLLHFSTF